jgi:ribose transport system ATP-binding protein
MRALEARGVYKSFGGVAALHNVDFEASSGEVHGLLGENGAGKSTFVKLVVGALRPDAGEITVFNNTLPKNYSPGQAKHFGISAVFQEVALIPDLSVSQNVWFRNEPRNGLQLISERRLLQMTSDLLERLEIRHIDPGALVKDLSLANRQLVDIARALARQPQILILDEATSALSPHEVDWTLVTARRIAAEGCLVIFISHRLREVRQVADRITIFRNAKAVGTHRMNTISDDRLIAEMLGRAPQQLYPPRHHAPSVRPILKVQDLTAGHRLRHVDLELHEGEILGVGGLQGQGQTELLLALAGLFPAKGEIQVQSAPARIGSPRQALRSGIALVPEDRQNQGLLLSKTIRQNVSLSVLDIFAAHGLLNLTREAAAVASMTKKLNVQATNIEQVVRTLSGGNQQKVLMARILLTNARILLLNDPVRGVDVGTKADIFTLLRQLTAEGYGIVFHSTDFQELVNLADRLLILRDGQISAILQSETLTEANALSASVGRYAA